MHENKIVAGYIMNIGYNKDKEEYHGDLILQKRNEVTDIIEMKPIDMEFIDYMDGLKKEIVAGKVFSLEYDYENDVFISSVKEKTYNGPYNEEEQWIKLEESKSINFGLSILELNNKLQEKVTKKEMQKCKKI